MIKQITTRVYTVSTESHRENGREALERTTKEKVYGKEFTGRGWESTEGRVCKPLQQARHSTRKPSAFNLRRIVGGVFPVWVELAVVAVSEVQGISS